MPASAPNATIADRNPTDAAYEGLRRRITRGEYLPSQRLVEAQVADDLKVGRYAVRQALARLQAEGLVTLEPNRGATVAAVSLQDAIDTLEAREYLEGAAAALAAERITPAALDALSDRLGELRTALASQAFDRYSETNRRFHAIIYDASGNRSLPQLIDVLKARVARLHLRTVLIPGRSERSLAEHEAIHAAIAAHDAAAAEAAARAHIRGLRETVEQAWDLVRF
jgi:DNA-binding GntR family transcriptional regulator